MLQFLKKHRLTFFASLALLFIGIQPARTLDDSQYWMKVRATDKFERSVIASLGVSIEVTRPDYVIAIGNYQELKRIEETGWLETSFPLTEENDFPAEDSVYHNYNEMLSTLQSLQQQNPEIMELRSIAKTHEKRDIWAVRISGDLKNGSQWPAIIYMGGHHAREHLSVELPIMWIQYLINEYRAGNQKIISLINHREIHIIPAVNPDGMEYDISTGRYKMWRKNRARNADGTYGVDLNRNYGYQWGTGGSSRDPNSDVYMGPQAFSEPETKAIRDYVESHNNITTLLSLHTYSELILYPWGHKYDGIEVARDKSVHETMAKKMAQWNGYTPQQSSELYIASGDTTDWSYGAHRIISFTFELDPANQWGGGGFYPGADVIKPVFDKNLQPMIYLLEFADNPYRSLEADNPFKPMPL